MSNSEILREFLLETHENLALLDTDLVKLEENPGSRETLAEVFRTFHSVKGTAGFMGLAKLQTVAHSAESLLSRLRAGEIRFNRPIATVLLRVVDAIREIVNNIVSRDLLPLLNAITDRGIAVILLAHAANTKITTPEGYDVRLAAPDIPQWIAPTFVEWADAVLYASRETTGERVLTTEGTSNVTAKNRYGLPSKVGLSWKDLSDAIQQGLERQSAGR